MEFEEFLRIAQQYFPEADAEDVQEVLNDIYAQQPDITLEQIAGILPDLAPAIRGEFQGEMGQSVPSPQGQQPPQQNMDQGQDQEKMAKLKALESMRRS